MSVRAAFRRVAFRVDGPGFVDFLERLGDLGLERQGGELLTAAHTVDHGAALSIYFVDPWGHRFEITTYEPDRVRELRA